VEGCVSTAKFPWFVEVSLDGERSLVKLHACSLGGSDRLCVAECFSNSFFFPPHVPLSTQHVRVTLNSADVNVCFQDTGLPGCFAGLAG
jgi:hypothetical protein